jgi:ABC-type multidrug transport system permease subunit
VETAQQVAFTTVFPITFISNAFVPLQALPGWLQPVAEWNPVSTLTASMRELFGNPNPVNGSGFPSQHPILMTVLWAVGFVAVFAPLAVRRYRDISK